MTTGDDFPEAESDHAGAGVATWLSYIGFVKSLLVCEGV